jgi:NAD(P)-dependent dehydrogenase (short-subunit alcohol dehydrogenase family)
VLVTGASSGVGLATAHRLAPRGARLALLARGQGPLERAAQECRRLGATWVGTLAVDVRDDDAVGRALAELGASQGAPDGVVSSAGVVAYGRLHELPAAVFDGVVATNLLGSANVLRHVLPGMRARGSGSIVVIGSMIGHIAVPTMSAYTVSKWGVRALARQAALENRDVPDLHVSYVSLPGVDTPIYRQAAYVGGPAGRPPPVVWSADKASRVVVRTLDRPRAVVHGGGFDALTRLGYTVLPRVYDAWVGPLFDRLASDPATHLPAQEGNVAHSVPEANRLGGGHGAGLRAAVSTFTSLLRNRR